MAIERSSQFEPSQLSEDDRKMLDNPSNMPTSAETDSETSNPLSPKILDQPASPENIIPISPTSQVIDRQVSSSTSPNEQKIENILGKASVEEKQRAREKLQANFLEQNFDALPLDIAQALKENEAEKPAYLIRLVELVNQAISEYCQKLGVNTHTIPLENVHFIPASTLGKLCNYWQYPLPFFRAVYSESEQAIFIKKSEDKPSQKKSQENDPAISKIEEMITVIHEMMHALSYQNAYLRSRPENGDNKPLICQNRSGFSIRSGKNPEDFKFIGINEALTEHITAKIANQCLSDPEIAGAIAEQSNISSEEFNKKLSYCLKYQGDYIFERRLLDYIASEIQSVNKDQFSSPEEVLDIFYRAYFSTHLKQPIRLIKRTFGDKGYQYIANCGNFRKPASLPFEVENRLKKIRRNRRMLNKILRRKQ